MPYVVLLPSTAVQTQDRERVVGACPTVREPFVARDGFLVRIGLAGGEIRSSEVAALAAAAGPDALIEVTNRANLQVRGLDEAAWERVIDCAEAFGRADNDRAGRVIADPFFGQGDGLLDITPIVSDVASRLVALPSLSPKFGVVIDSGGAVHVRGRRASIALGAVLVDGEVRFEVALDSSLDGGPVGTIAVADAADAVASIATTGTLSGFDMANLRNPDKVVRGSLVVGTHVPLGRQPTAWWTEFAASFPAETLLRVTTRSSVVAPLLEETFAITVVDPARQVVTCIGAQGCEFGHADTLRDATELIEQLRATRTTPSARIHLSGCAKQCASREQDDIQLIATDGDRYELAVGE